MNLAKLDIWEKEVDNLVTKLINATYDLASARASESSHLETLQAVEIRDEAEKGLQLHFLKLRAIAVET